MAPEVGGSTPLNRTIFTLVKNPNGKSALTIDPSLILYVAFIFIVAGLAKGIVGNGLPIISIALLTMILGLQEAIAIAVIPAFATNIWQASNGGYFKTLIRRLWPYLLASIVAVAFGTRLLITMDQSILTIILGVLVTIYSAMGVSGKELLIPARLEKIAGPIFGALTGFVAGMTGSPAFPGMFFLNGLGFNRNKMVQALGLAFSFVTATVFLSMHTSQLMGSNQIAMSLFAVIPAMVGTLVGTKLRHHMSEKLFKKMFYSSMLVLGLILIMRSIGRLSG